LSCRPRWIELRLRSAAPELRSGGAFVFADGRIYFQSEDGITTAIRPGRTFAKLAASSLEGSTLASMGVSGGSLFIRTDRYLYRIAARPPR